MKKACDLEFHSSEAARSSDALMKICLGAATEMESACAKRFNNLGWTTRELARPLLRTMRWAIWNFTSNRDRYWKNWNGNWAWWRQLPGKRDWQYVSSEEQIIPERRRWMRGRTRLLLLP